MKCEDVEKSLSLYLSDELKSDEKRLVQDHLNECPDCRESLALHRLSSRALAGQGFVPASLQAKTWQQLQPKLDLNWLARIVGDPKMTKFAVVSAAAAILAVSFIGLAPQIAQANTAKKALTEMNLALAQAASRGEITLNVTSTKEGQVTVTGSMDGKPLPTTFPVDVKVTREGVEAVTVEVSINFEIALYESVSFGKDKNTLEVIPKGAKDKRFLVSLDPKTRLPLSVSSSERKGKVWKETSRSTYRTVKEANYKPINEGSYKPIADAKASPAATKAKAVIKMNLGQTATVTITTS